MRIQVRRTKVVMPEFATETSAGEPWPLPTGWTWLSLREVCRVNPRRPRLERACNAPTSFLPMPAVNEVDGVIVDRQVRPYREVARGYTYFEEEDVLFAKITPSMQNGKCAVARGLTDKIGFGSTEFHVLRPGSSVTSDWLHHFLRRAAFRIEAQGHFRGAVGQQRVPQDFIESALIPVPPTTDIQRRIVARIETMLAEVKEARALAVSIRCDTDRLMEAALGEAFEKPPQEWLRRTIGEVLAGIATGTTPPSKVDRYYGGGVVWFTPGDLGDRKLLIASVRTISQQAIVERKARLFKAGTLLFVGIGATLGKVGIAGADCSANQQITGLKFSDEVLVDFAYYWFRGNYSTVRDKAGTSTLPILNQADLKALPFSFPRSKADQAAIAAHLDSIQDEVYEMRALHMQDAELFDQVEQAILERAFRGEL